MMMCEVREKRREKGLNDTIVIVNFELLAIDCNTFDHVNL